MTTTPAPLSEEEFAAFENWANEGGMLPPPHKLRDQLRRIAAELRAYRAAAQGDYVEMATAALLELDACKESRVTVLARLLASVHREAVEMAAGVAERYADEHERGALMSMAESIHSAAAGREIAAAIRRLAVPPSPPEKEQET